MKVWSEGWGGGYWTRLGRRGWWKGGGLRLKILALHFADWYCVNPSERESKKKTNKKQKTKKRGVGWKGEGGYKQYFIQLLFE